MYNSVLMLCFLFLKVKTNNKNKSSVTVVDDQEISSPSINVSHSNPKHEENKLLFIQNDGGECIRIAPAPNASVSKDSASHGDIRTSNSTSEVTLSEVQVKVEKDLGTTSLPNIKLESEASISKCEESRVQSPGTPLLDEPTYSPVCTLDKKPITLPDNSKINCIGVTDHAGEKTNSSVKTTNSECKSDFICSSKTTTEPNMASKKYDANDMSINNIDKTKTKPESTSNKLETGGEIPHAFESNMMQLYSSVKALKEAERPGSSTSKGNNTGRDDKISKDIKPCTATSSSRHGKHSISPSSSSCRSSRHHHSMGVSSKNHSSRSKHHGKKENSSTKETDSKSRPRSDSASDRKHYCSKCHKRSKVKRASIGVQCRRDKTFDKYVSNNILSDFSTNKNIKIQTKHNALPRPMPFSPSGAEYLKYSKFIRIETYPNGGASVVHMYQDEIQGLSVEEMEELATEYFKVSIIFQNFLHCFYKNILISEVLLA